MTCGHSTYRYADSVHDHDAISRELLDHGVSASCATEIFKRTYEDDNNDGIALRALLKCGADANVIIGGFPVLFQVVKWSTDCWLVDLLMEHNADPNILCEVKEFPQSRRWTNKIKITPLFVAAESKD